MPGRSKPRKRLGRRTRIRRRLASLRDSLPVPAPSRPTASCPPPRKAVVRSVVTIPSHSHFHFIRPVTSSSSTSGRLDSSQRYDTEPPTPSTHRNAPSLTPHPSCTPYDFLVPTTPNGTLPPTPGKWYRDSRPAPAPAPTTPSQEYDDDVIIIDDAETFSPTLLASPPPKRPPTDVPRRNLGF